MGDLPERTSPVPADDPPTSGRSTAARRKSGRKKGAKQPAETLPVARVAVDMSLPHLDRPFDYLVPVTLDAVAVPGCRVRVRFAGQLVDGFLLDRVEKSDHEGRLAYLERVTSPEPVLAPEIAALAREIADRYAGTLADVLRLAIPPRHARVEAEDADESPDGAAPVGEADEGQAAPPPSTEEEPPGYAAAATAGAAGAAGTDVTSAVTSAPGAGVPSEGEPPGRGTEAVAPAGAARAVAGEGEETGVGGAIPNPGHPAAHPAGPETEGEHGRPAEEGDATAPDASVVEEAPRPEPSEERPGEEQAGPAGRDTSRERPGEVAGMTAPGASELPLRAGEERPGSAGRGASRGRRSDGAGVTAPGSPVVEAPPRLVPSSERPLRASEERPGSAGRNTSRDRPGEAAGATAPGPSAVGEPPRLVPSSERPMPADEGRPVAGGASAGRDASRTSAGVEPGPWAAYPAGPSFLDAVEAGRGPRAVWNALPGADWTSAIARAAKATLAGGRGVLIVVADGRDVARVDAALTRELGEGRHVALTAELGPAERYRRWLAVRRGRVRTVVGTRAAIFAPVRDLGLVVLWDDGDDVHAEQHAPYPHAREVLALRAHRAGAGALIGGFTRTTDATQLLAAGWAHPLVPDRERLRASMPYIRPSGDDADLARDEAARSARLPHLAFRTARQGLEHGPVLVQVPRRGYVPALACSRCRGPARCTECEGPLSLRSSHAAPYCRWCGRIAGAWTCPECGGRQVRAVVVGARRTAEELGRAFPGVPIRTSGRDGVLDGVTGEPALVVATPGAEPVAEGGYAAALLLDGWVLLGRADLRAGEEALRRWMNASALVRPRGPVIVLADGSLTTVQALIRWDPVTYAERELAERRDLGFPPAVRMASLTGAPQSVRELVDAAGLPQDAEVLGPVEVGEGQERALVRVERARGVALSRLLKTAQAARSTRKTADVVRVRVDPLELI
nr:primosomal protein N' [Actinoallomurus bryophytorum]